MCTSRFFSSNLKFSILPEIGPQPSYGIFFEISIVCLSESEFPITGVSFSDRGFCSAGPSNSVVRPTRFPHGFSNSREKYLGLVPWLRPNFMCLTCLPSIEFSAAPKKLRFYLNAGLPATKKSVSRIFSGVQVGSKNLLKFFWIKLVLSFAIISLGPKKIFFTENMITAKISKYKRKKFIR
jgi:hypothetical protein